MSKLFDEFVKKDDERREACNLALLEDVKNKRKPYQKCNPFEKELEEQGPLSEEDAAFRIILRDTLKEQGKLDEVEAVLDERWVTCVTRGYRTYKKRLEDSVECLMKLAKYRKDMKIDNIFFHQLKDRESEFHKLWPIRHMGQDIHGHPILYECIGDIKLKEILNDYTHDEVCYYRAQQLEFFQQYKRKVKLEKNGKVVGVFKQCWILDVTGAGTSHFMGKAGALIKKVFAVASQYFPESLYQLWIRNAGFIFSMAWKILSIFIHQNTIDKIKIEGKSPYVKMQQNGMPLSIIPKCCGGENDGTLFSDILATVREEGYNRSSTSVLAEADVQATEAEKDK